MVLITLSQDYPTSVLADLKSQDLSSEENVVLLSSGDQSVSIHTFLLRNVSELLFNLLVSASLQSTIILLPPSPPSTLANLVTLLYEGYVTGLDRLQADHLAGLAIDLGILMTIENVQKNVQKDSNIENMTSDDDSDGRSVIFTGKHNEYDVAFPSDENSDFADDDDDEEEEEDHHNKQLKVETIIFGKNDRDDLKLSFPKCRLTRDLSNVDRFPKMKGFDGRIQYEYNFHPVGQYMGPYDQNEKLQLSVQLPKSNLNFRDYTEFSHEGEECFEYCLESYKRYDDLDKIRAYRIEDKVEVDDGKNASNLDESESDDCYYTCQFEMCRIPCPCPLCHLHEKSVHKTAEIRVQCDLCQKTFASDFVLKNHQKYAHSNARNESCPYCDEKFKQKKVLRVHLAHVHDVDRMKETYGEELEKRDFKCSDCDSTFGYKKNLNAHVKAKHGNKVCVFECEECQSKFSNKRTLVEHVKRKHGTQQAKHTCPVCGKSFDQKKILMKHEVLHNPR